MMTLRTSPILAILAIGICVPIPALAYLSPEEVFGIELPGEEPPAESLPSLEEAALPATNGTGAASDENGGTPSDADTETADESDVLLRPAAEEEPATDTVRTFYRGGERVDVAEPAAGTGDADSIAQNQPTEEELFPAQEDTAYEEADPGAFIEALQAAERQAEMAEAEATGQEEAEGQTETEGEPAPSARGGVLLGIGGIELIGIAAVLGALSLGAFMLLKKKMASRASVPESPQQSTVPPPPAEPSSTRLQEAIEDIKEEASHNEGTPGTDTGAQQ